MTKQELIEENNRLKAELKEIYSYTSLEPLDEKEKEYDKEGNFSVIYAKHLGHISAIVELALIPDYFLLPDEEKQALFKALQTP